MTSFRPPKQWVLQEVETITSFCSWQSNIKYHLSLNNEFTNFIDTNFTWSKQSVTNRGLVADGADSGIAEAQRKSAVQKCIQLERMLGLIAQFSPSLLRNDIIKKSTSLNWIWKRIRKHYQFRQSEVNFLKLSAIKLQDGERYETLYQRIIAHLEDNLLTVESEIQFDGEAVTTNEEMSPTTERLAVYLWLTLIDERLPSFIARIYAHDLQSKSLKDIQPQICDALDSLLVELNTQEDIQIKYNKSSFHRRKATYPSNNRLAPVNNQAPHQTRQKTCFICKALGRPYIGHNLSSCWHVSKSDKIDMAKAFQVDVDYSGEEDIQQLFSVPEYMDNLNLQQQCSTENLPASITQRVQSGTSPFFFAFYQHHVCKVVIDTGATSSLISSAFVKKACIQVKPTHQSARQLDRSTLPISGEAKFDISFGHSILSVDGLVSESLDCDILAGVPFCQANDIDVFLRKEEISISGKSFPYGGKPNTIQHDVYRAESIILRNDSAKVLFPGEFIEISSDTLNAYEGEVAIEPRLDSPLQGTWPAPALSRVIQGTIRIPNQTGEPIHIKKAKHLAQICLVTTPEISDISSRNCVPPASKSPPPTNTSFSDSIILDPDGQLSKSDRLQFISLHKNYDNVFNPVFGVYNGHSGAIKAHVNFGPVLPPSNKPRLPFYNQTNLRQLQEEADKLESLGVLAKPEDLGVNVVYASPSFLVKKPNGGQRFVTAFNELSQYVRIPPAISNTCDSVLRKLSSWKHLIKSDLTQSFFQIPVTKASMPYLGTVTPFRGLRIYCRSAMGMPGSSEHLQELLSRVLGDFMQEGFVIVIADDLHVGGNSIKELLNNWMKVLQRMQDNNLTLSSSKTFICPTSTTILGWKWSNGCISISPHKISPLSAATPPVTCSAMRSYIGAYKALCRCIPRYSSLMSPLEDAIKGLQGAHHIVWSDELREHFKQSQEALKAPSILTIPNPSDKLIMTVDASPLNDGIGATLFILRDDKRYISEFFSLKLKSHQTNWQPCELEALAITAAIRHFAPYIRESKHILQILSDSKPCVQAFSRLRKGKFSASSRISTFLSCLSEHNVTLCHLKGEGNKSSDFGSRNPISCSDSSCQICSFVNETAESVVHAVSVEDVLSGSATMPFINKIAWKSAQQDCPALRKTYAHLTAGTRPSRKAKNLRDVRRFLEVASINQFGVLVVRKSDPYMHQRELTIVPRDILPGLLTAIHLHFQHATILQLNKLFRRYFFAICSDQIIKTVVDNCFQCNSLKSLPKELFTQNSSPSPIAPGQLFAADVIKRNKQAIFAIRDVHSSYTVATIISDESKPSLRTALITTTTNLRFTSCLVRVDNAPGFSSLKDDDSLRSRGIRLDFGRVKNLNKNAVAEKCNQELENELLRIDPTGSPVTDVVLQDAIHLLNSRVRNRGLSAKEILLCRDQITLEPLIIDDKLIGIQQHDLRTSNHIPSAKCKGRNGKLATVAQVATGSLVFIKGERNKYKGRDMYIIVAIKGENAVLQKINSGKFMSRKYDVPLTNIFLAVHNPPLIPPLLKQQAESEEDSSDDCVSSNSNDSISDSVSLNNNLNEDNQIEPVRRSVRHRQEPAWLRNRAEWERS